MNYIYSNQLRKLFPLKHFIKSVVWNKFTYEDLSSLNILCYTTVKSAKLSLKNKLSQFGNAPWIIKLVLKQNFTHLLSVTALS